jgi:hypothetical protein
MTSPITITVLPDDRVNAYILIPPYLVILGVLVWYAVNALFKPKRKRKHLHK